MSRYFDEEMEESEESKEDNEDEEIDRERSRKCYRCGGRGHIARTCDKEEVIKCIYCLGPHFNNECPEKVCRNCGEKGHYKLVASLLLRTAEIG